MENTFTTIVLFLRFLMTRVVPKPRLLRIYKIGLGTDRVRLGYGSDRVQVGKWSKPLIDENN